MAAASTSMAQRWPVVLNFNQYRMNGGLALPTGAAALFQKPLLLAGPYRGRGPGGPTPAPRPNPGRPPWWPPTCRLRPPGKPGARGQAGRPPASRARRLRPNAVQARAGSARNSVSSKHR